MTAVCSLCRIEKPLHEFDPGSKKNGRSSACIPCARARSRRYYAANPAKYASIQREKNKNPAVRKWRRDWARIYYQKTRTEMLAAYGCVCSCCGETETKFLTLEHLRQDGAAHRRRLGSPANVMFWLKNNGWPKDGFTLKCWNCNTASYFHGGCPHETTKQEGS